MKHILRKHYLNALLLVSAVLAYVGYHIYFIHIGEKATFFDIVYSVLRLFIFENDFEKEALNVYLNIARFMAPASLATVVIREILSLFSSTLKKGQARLYKQHVIFCGDSPNLKPLIREQSTRKKHSICIHRLELEQPPAPRMLNFLYSQFSAEILNDIAFYQSDYVIISNQNDLHSIEYATSLVQSINFKYLKKKIEVVLVFNNPEWSEVSNDLGLLEELDQQLLENPFLNIRYINYLDRGIRKLMLQCPPDKFKPVLSPGDDLPVVLITGFNALSKRLIISLALNCHYLNHQKIKIFLHSKMEKEIAAFMAKYQLEKMIDLSCTSDEALKDFSTKIDVSYLCDIDPINLYRKLALISRNSQIKSSSKIVCSDKLLSKSHFSRKVDHVFEGGEETDTLTALVDESIDEMAMTIHMNYIQTQKANKQLTETIDTHKEWEKLSDETKDRNRYPADHMYSKIRAMNCELCDVTDAREAFDIEGYSYLEDLSEAEHNRWCAYMYYKGWRQGVPRDKELKIHPDLIPYEQLDKTSKRKDHENILQTPKLLALRNLKLVEIERTKN
jgi:RyR domain